MKQLTEQEIIQLIKDNNLDIKQLAAIATTINQEDTAVIDSNKTSTTVGKSSKASVSFELTLCNYPDICITRTTPTTIKQLVIMPSKNSYYITSLKGGGKAGVVKLDADLYAEFTSGMEDIELPADFWIDKIIRGKKAYEHFMTYLLYGSNNERTMIDMIKDRCAKRLIATQYYTNYDAAYRAYSRIPILYKEFRDDKKIINFCESSIDTVAHIQSMFGLNNARDYLKSLSLSLVDPSNLYTYYYNRSDDFSGSVLPRYEMQYAAFKEYTLYTAVRCGYGLTWREFFNTWRDTLEMQKQIYGKIREKYPDNLPTYHNQMSYYKTLHKAEIDEANFARNSKLAAKYEWKMDADEGRFIFLAPTCAQDFYDEAAQQANCLAGYVQKFTDGEDIIIFMRDKKSPEKSEVTLEIVNNHITQAYRASNHAMTDEERRAVAMWAKKFKIEYGGI